MPRRWIPKTFEEACKRASGRRRYHAQRRRVRDDRQLVIMDILRQLNWQHYGTGRILAEALSVDPATISRDIKDILKWRGSFLTGRGVVGEKLVDAVIQRLVAAGIHPRRVYSWTYNCNQGIQSLTIRRR
jgi:hypothetical protein